MKNTIRYIKDNLKLILGTLAVGLLFGWLFFHSGDVSSEQTDNTEHSEHEHKTKDPEVWTCSMHPQIKQNKPGDCPICAMDLIPLASMDSGDDVSPDEITMTESAAKLASIQTMIVTSGTPEKSIHLQGKIQEDERNISELTARYGGRIEQLFVNFTGQSVRKGQKLATIYSPELVSAQRELLEAIALKNKRPTLYNATRQKLKLWDLTDAQINSIETKGKPQQFFDVLSPISGTVAMRHVAVGDYVKVGNPLFKLVDLSTIWALFDAYETDLPWLKLSHKVDFTIQSLPGKNFSGKISFIDPFIDPKTRVAKVRLNVRNPQLVIKPEMFINGIVQSQIATSGSEILIPKTAILWTGKRAVVYVKVPNRENPSFIYRQVVLGPEAGNFYVVASGLHPGEEIAINGVFKIDAAAQLQGLPSMMNPTGGTAASAHSHHHGDHGAEDTAVGRQADHGHQHHDTDASQEKAEYTSFKVGGNCGMCKSRIEKAVMTVEGVISTKWDADSKMLHLRYREGTSIDKVHEVIAAQGHDTDKVKASDEVYNNLHGCCKYDRL
ncbi:efflux RND transporter periplasmic adaptor subunit [Puteibacter caeruleilacunae]|nr:efflux RND transporter periplasmic adaptor subunit [Puteibacter caeruleilacunae]